MRLRILWCAIALLVFRPLQGQSQPLIDHHQHFWPGCHDTVSGVEPITATELIVLLESAGIRRAVVLSVAYQFGNPNKSPMENEYSQVRAENDWTSRQVAGFPDVDGYSMSTPLSLIQEELKRIGIVPP